MRDLIDTTEMYLRTVYELDEEGIPALRARLVERLHLSAPAVSETVARLVDDGLLHMGDDRTLTLTASGLERARGVMRKHRLAERLLIDVIGLDWPLVHTEACRWEHVISDEAERRLTAVLGAPERDAHGNPIPGLTIEEHPGARALLTMEAAAARGDETAVIERISEHLQADVDEMRRLDRHGLRPDVKVAIAPDGDGVLVRHDDDSVRLDGRAAQLIYVRPLER